MLPNSYGCGVDHRLDSVAQCMCDPAPELSALAARSDKTSLTSMIVISMVVLCAAKIVVIYSIIWDSRVVNMLRFP